MPIANGNARRMHQAIRRGMAEFHRAGGLGAEYYRRRVHQGKTNRRLFQWRHNLCQKIAEFLDHSDCTTGDKLWFVWPTYWAEGGAKAPFQGRDLVTNCSHLGSCAGIIPRRKACPAQCRLRPHKLLLIVAWPICHSPMAQPRAIQPACCCTRSSNVSQTSLES